MSITSVTKNPKTKQPTPVFDSGQDVIVSDLARYIARFGPAVSVDDRGLQRFADRLGTRVVSVHHLVGELVEFGYAVVDADQEIRLTVFRAPLRSREEVTR